MEVNAAKSSDNAAHHVIDPLLVYRLQIFLSLIVSKGPDTTDTSALLLPPAQTFPPGFHKNTTETASSDPAGPHIREAVRLPPGNIHPTRIPHGRTRPGTMFLPGSHRSAPPLCHILHRPGAVDHQPERAQLPISFNNGTNVKIVLWKPV